MGRAIPSLVMFGCMLVLYVGTFSALADGLPVVAGICTVLGSVAAVLLFFNESDR